MRKFYFLSAVVAVIIGLSVQNVKAEDYVITIKDNQFLPKELTIPAEQKVKIIIKNLDAKAAEFESHELNREKIVGANSEASIFVGPLKAGKYNYLNDFNPSTKGVIVVK